MERYQDGHIYEASNAFHVRYYAFYTDLPADKKARIAARCQRTGRPIPDRVQVSEKLCRKDTKHHSCTCKPVKKLCDDFMQKINNQTPGDPSRQQITVADFWETKYLPFIRDNRRAGTVYSYQKIWNKHLKAHFGQKTLSEYQTYMANEFLDELAKTLRATALQHVRSLASGIFTFAVNRGWLKSNPWNYVKIAAKIRSNPPKKHYTLQEALNVIGALAGHPDAQLVIALTCFLGLRPGETQVLRWEDFSSVASDACPICKDEYEREIHTRSLQEPHVHIRRAIGHGEIGDPKTKSSIAPLPIRTVVAFLKAWYEQSGKPQEGWVFPNKTGNPLDLKSLTRRVIMPTLQAKGVEWKPLYAGRRGAGTILTGLTGNALASKELLRHKDIAVTTSHYVKSIPEALLTGMDKLEEQTTKLLKPATTAGE